MRVRMPNIPGIVVRIDIFRLTQAGFSIALHVHVRNLNISAVSTLRVVTEYDRFHR